MEASLWKRLRYHEQGAKSNSKGKEEGTLKKGTNDPIKMIARKGVLKWDQYGKFEGPLGWTVMEDPIPHWKNLKGTNDLTVAKLDLESLRGCLDKKILSLNFHHSSFITQFFTPVWHHHPISIIQYFHIVCGPYTCHSATFCFWFLFFCFFGFFFPIPRSLNQWKKKGKKKVQITRTQWKKKKKKTQITEPSERRRRKKKREEHRGDRTQKKKGKKKKEKKGGRTPRRPNPGEEREGKKKKGKVWLSYD